MIKNRHDSDLLGDTVPSSIRRAISNPVTTKPQQTHRLKTSGTVNERPVSQQLSPCLRSNDRIRRASSVYWVSTESLILGFTAVLYCCASSAPMAGASRAAACASSASTGVFKESLEPDSRASCTTASRLGPQVQTSLSLISSWLFPQHPWCLVW